MSDNDRNCMPGNPYHLPGNRRDNSVPYGSDFLSNRPDKMPKPVYIVSGHVHGMPDQPNHLPCFSDHLRQPSHAMSGSDDQLPSSDHSLPAIGDRVLLCRDSMHPNRH